MCLEFGIPMLVSPKKKIMFSSTETRHRTDLTVQVVEGARQETKNNLVRTSSMNVRAGGIMGPRNSSIVVRLEIH